MLLSKSYIIKPKRLNRKSKAIILSRKMTANIITTDTNSSHLFTGLKKKRNGNKKKNKNTMRTCV